ncbi:MAG: chromate efflux transporter, partial [Myxococcales bacterium]|nr:chromate efflux transporter [Myxococcales bacterium]
FGGPAGQIAIMHRVLVEERRWLSEERFLHALNFAMLLPGPEAQQLMTYQGWLSHGYRGGLVAGWMFVVPGFIAILGMSSMYASYHEVPAVAAALLGLKAAVLAIVAEAVLRIGRRVLTNGAAVLLALGAFVALFFGQVPFPVVLLVAAAAGLLAPRFFPPPTPPSARPSEGEEPLLDAEIRAGRLAWIAPRPGRDLGVAIGLIALWLLPTVVLWVSLGPDSRWTQVATFFSEASLLTFGGAYAVLAWVAQQAVEVRQWLTPEQMLDGLGLAESTPGPLIQVVQFVGFMATAGEPGGMDPRLAGSIGSVLTTWVTFWPSFVFVLAGAPYVERLRRVPALSSALRAITCAVVGVVGNLAAWLALHVLFGTVDERALGPLRLLVPAPSSIDLFAAVVAVASAVALLRLRWPMVVVLIAAVVAGLAWFVVSWLVSWGLS